MKYLLPACICALLLWPVAAAAETEAERRALADLITGQIRAALNGENYVVIEDCDAAGDCSILISR